MSVTRSTHPEEVHDVSPTTRAVVGASTDGVRAGSTSGVLVRLRTSVLARDVVLASLVSLILGLIRLGAPSLWEDEAFTWAEMQYSLGKKLDVQLHFLHLVLVEPWAALAGTSEWALRFPSVIGATVAVGSLVVLANKLFDRRVASVERPALAASPFFVKWSQQARAYDVRRAVPGRDAAAAARLHATREVRGPSSASPCPSSSSGIPCRASHAAGVRGLHRAAAGALPTARSPLRRDRRDPRGALGRHHGDAIQDPDELDRVPDTRGGARAVLDASGAVGIGLVLAGVGLLGAPLAPGVRTWPCGSGPGRCARSPWPCSCRRFSRSSWTGSSSRQLRRSRCSQRWGC